MTQPDQGWNGGGAAGGQQPSPGQQQWGQPPGSPPQWGQQAPQWGAPTGHPAPPGPGRSRTWIVLGCAGLVVVLLLLAITGGVAVLLSRDRGSGEETTSAAEPVVFETGDFRVEYPADWETHEITSDEEGFGKLLHLVDVKIPEEDALDEFPPNSLEIYLYDSDVHAKTECELQAIWAGFLWDESGDQVALEDPQLGGRAVSGYTKSGTHDGQDAVTEGFCADVGDQIVQVVVETHGATEISPELREILASWTWVEG